MQVATWMRLANTLHTDMGIQNNFFEIFIFFPICAASRDISLPGNNKNRTNVYPNMALYWADVLATVETG